MSPGFPELLSCLLQELMQVSGSALTVMLLMYALIRLSHPEQTKTLKPHIMGLHEKSCCTESQHNQLEEASVLHLLRTRNAYIFCINVQKTELFNLEQRAFGPLGFRSEQFSDVSWSGRHPLCREPEHSRTCDYVPASAFG